jgi:hypothetical protein
MRLQILLTAFAVVTAAPAYAGQSAGGGGGRAAGTSPQPTGDPVVQVGVFSYQPDGSRAGAAFDTDPNLRSTVYLGSSFCQLGAGDNPAPDHATHAWRFSGKIVSKSADEAVVQLTWQRVLDQGQPATVPEGTVQLTLRNGDRVPLDTVMSQSQSACAVTNAVFEARYMARPFGIFKSGPGQKPVDVTGTTISFGAGGRATTGSVSVRNANGTKVRSNEAARVPQPGRTFTVELWLVHSVPGKPDEVLHQTLRVSDDGTPFEFAPVTIETGNGSAVQVTGSVATPGGDKLIFIANRKVTIFARSGERPRDGAFDSQGTSRTIRQLPSPTDVLSFEMPPIRVTANGSPIADQFAVRVRVTPQ